MTIDEVKRQLFVNSDDVLGNNMVDLDEAQNCCDTSFSIGYNKAIDDFSHEIKETFNLEIPLNYPSAKPFFTLENARKLVEDVAEQLKDGDGE